MNKWIIVTGAGTGIGAATAKILAMESNINLILVGRRIEKLESVRRELNRKDDHLIQSIDISDKLSVQMSFAELKLDEKNIIGLFANAGIGGENTYGADDRWGEILDINLNGTYHSIMETLPHLRKSPEKAKNIVITSSCLARFGVPNYTAYCTSKAGLLGLTKSLAVQYASESILVNAICPGWVDTDMARQGIQLLADREDMSYDEMLKIQMGYVPTGRMSHPDEIGKMVRFLLLNDEISMTGQGIDINNGAWMG